jgi:hypothetical protein
LERAVKEGSAGNSELLELAMRHFCLCDFDNAIKYFEKVDKEQDELGFHILGSRLYSEAGRMAEMPKTARLSFGDTSAGRWLDKNVFFWRKQKIGREQLKQRAEEEARQAVSHIFERGDLKEHLEAIGDYKVYRIGLNGFVKGFVVLKAGDYAALKAEKETEELFERRVAGGKFRSVHPVCIMEHGGTPYLVQFYEDGTLLSESKNPKHFEDAMRFAAKSDALMPVNGHDYDPKVHFLGRLEEFPDDVRLRIEENCGFLFKYWGDFPPVFDGDPRPDGNCLVGEWDTSIFLDKQRKSPSIGPVTAARVLFQGTEFTDSWQARDGMIGSVYLPAYGMGKVESPELFVAVTCTSALEKSITAYCYDLKSKKAVLPSTRIFTANGAECGERVCQDPKMRRFYSPKELRQCEMLERIVREELLVPIAP